MSVLMRTAALAAGLMAFAAPVMAADLKFTLTNKTSEILTHFYTSPVGVNDWEEDVFGDQVLNPGESMTITISDGRNVCKYDMKFEFEGSDKLDTTTDTQDLCETGKYTLND